MIWVLAAAAALQTAPAKQEAADGPFKVVMLAVPDLEQFDREWAIQTEGAQLTTTSSLVRATPSFVIILFGGCERDANDTCRIDVTHKVTGPDGKPYDGLDGSKRVSPANVPVKRANAFYAAPQIIGLRIEPGEALGPYQVQVTVSDLNARRTAVVRQTLTAVEAE